MDRIITKAEKRKAMAKTVAKSMVGVAIAAGVFALIIAFFKPALSRESLVLSTVDRGKIEVSVSGDGRVVPAFEEMINAPMDSRILEVYCKVGDTLSEGTPILRLDLKAVEIEYQRLQDEYRIKQLQLEQLRLNNQTNHNDRVMQIKIATMRLQRTESEYLNEQYLDSLGSGTTDKVRQAQMAYETGKLELEEKKQQFANDQRIKAADMEVKELELAIFARKMEEHQQLFEDAIIKSPSKAILTSVTNQIGSRVGKGAEMAIISDLSRFKLEGEISEVHSEKVRLGKRVEIRIGRELYHGMVSNINPLSRNGLLSFSVEPNDNTNTKFRPGIKADLYILSAVRDEVLRVGKGAYYVGPGEYKMFVLTTKSQLVARDVRLGESNFDYVEVVSGLEAGEQVAINNLYDLAKNEKIDIKD